MTRFPSAAHLVSWAKFCAHVRQASPSTNATAALVPDGL